MRLAILSDIHGNLEALEAVLADARERRCTEFVCLGDVVGYNANPRECVERIRALECPVVKGNHDEEATLSTSAEHFNELAERAIEWTRDSLPEQEKEWLRALPLQMRVHDFTIVHATLDTPGQWGYVFSKLDAVASFTYQRTPVCFFGHTHVPTVFVRDQGGVRQERKEHIRIEPGRKYFINAGSVGQPRDGNWRAAYCIYDVANDLVELVRVKYDVATAQKKIENAGLPELLAERIAIGR